MPILSEKAWNRFDMRAVKLSGGPLKDKILNFHVDTQSFEWPSDVSHFFLYSAKPGDPHTFTYDGEFPIVLE